MREIEFRKITSVSSTRKTLIIPPFLYANTFTGVSELMARYAIQNTNPFTFKRPVTQPNESFVAAVSWSDGTYTFRYKFAKLGVLYFPYYTGEQIGTNAYFEIWNVDEEPAAEITENWTLTVSKLVLPSLCNCIVNSESVQLAPSVPTSIPPYMYSNPFCTPLCS